MGLTPTKRSYSALWGQKQCKRFRQGFTEIRTNRTSFWLFHRINIVLLTLHCAAFCYWNVVRKCWIPKMGWGWVSRLHKEVRKTHNTESKFSYLRFENVFDCCLYSGAAFYWIFAHKRWRGVPLYYGIHWCRFLYNIGCARINIRFSAPNDKTLLIRGRTAYKFSSAVAFLHLHTCSMLFVTTSSSSRFKLCFICRYTLRTFYEWTRGRAQFYNDLFTARHYCEVTATHVSKEKIFLLELNGARMLHVQSSGFRTENTNVVSKRTKKTRGNGVSQ